jgi:two-component system chemotaxis sensor kinase CheA
MDELINDFIAETREMLQALGVEIVAWEAAPDDRARLDEIFRFVHTVKGNCGFFDLPRLAALSHAAEDALAEVRAGRRVPDGPLVSAVLAIIDRIGELALALETGEAIASEDDEQLIRALAPGQGPAEIQAADTPDTHAESRKAQRSIRLSVDLLDRMMSGVSDAVLARNELARRLRETPADMGVEAAFERVSGCIAEIRDAITRTRMQRIDSLFAALPRVVRDIAGELGKQVRLDVDGGDVELDREMIEMIRDPLTHMVRNAIGHGLEGPDERRAAAKDAVGTLSVCARQSGNQILIEVADDGRGIDSERLVRKAIEAGVLTPERAERLTPAQQNALMFEAGLSTANEVTAISGRGVGMDVVRANIERIGGLIEVESKRGKGVRFTIRVPLTLTIIPALTISAAGQIFAVPRAAIEEILRAGGAAVRTEQLGETCIATVRGRRMPLVSLAVLFGQAPAQDWAGQTIVLLKPAGGSVYALAIDAVHDHEELVVKPAAPAVMAAGFYAGTTLADDGRPVLLLDPSGIAARAEIRFDEVEDQARAAEPDESGASAGSKTRLLLFRSLDGARRAVRLNVVERIEDVPTASVKRTGGRLRVTLDNRILPLAGCDAAPAEDRLRVLRLTDGSSELAYAFAEVVDIVPLSGEIRPAGMPGPVEGVVLVGGEQVELIDPYWLFAEAGETGDAARPVCAIPSGDPWLDNMLRPMVESLGYRVVAAGEGVVADIVIVSAETPEPAITSGAQLLRLRATAQPGGNEGDTIYRYDRAALLAALGGARRDSVAFGGAQRDSVAFGGAQRGTSHG